MVLLLKNEVMPKAYSKTWVTNIARMRIGFLAVSLL